MAATAVAPLVTLVFFLPVRLLSLAFGLCIPTFPSAARAHRVRSAAAALTIAALLTVICAVPDAEFSFASEAEALRSEIGELRLKLARLESILETNTKNLRSKPFSLEGDNKLIEAMEHDTQILMNQEESSEKFQSKFYSERNIYMMEDELQILQQEVRKINDIAYSIESLAIDAEKRVEFLGSEVKKIDNIIAEQWIQIRQFEQAFVLTKTMTSQVYARRLSENPYKLPSKEILKYIRNVDLHGMFHAVALHSRISVSNTYKHCRNFVEAMNGCYHKASRFHKAIRHQSSADVEGLNVFFLGGSISRSCISFPYKQFRISILSAQKFHHKVQVYVEGAMRSNRYSRSLASELITSWLAYLVVISPIWISWILFSSRFC
ncbi:uncharacterized protein LOC124657713 isoform X1 [Lolium rigidum]|uniref:uncharacterized protein LOC124657713 isoform X1 n=1 Tax=Lolium rigidum TaxID=89674 RepID=UPI001F5CDA59|nr:uncharacterized protein LOC124657713 isoform X1 [Lolium rigidum]